MKEKNHQHRRRDDQHPGVALDWDGTQPAGTTQQVKHGDVPSVEITLRQAETLVDIFGGHDALVSVIARPDAWTNMDPGLYAYFSEYPEEGTHYLGPTEVDDDLAMNGRAPAAPIKTWRERLGLPADFPMHIPSNVEHAMLSEIAELRGSLTESELTLAARAVLAERQRQVDREGYSHKNDNVHILGELGAYAAFYAMPPAARDWPAAETGYGATWGEAIVPRDWAAPKPGDRRGELIKAGALILAEIERLDRAEGRQS
jgi:hypothetical protein